MEPSKGHELKKLVDEMSLGYCWHRCLTLKPTNSRKRHLHRPHGLHVFYAIFSVYLDSMLRLRSCLKGSMKRTTQKAKKLRAFSYRQKLETPISWNIGVQLDRVPSGPMTTSFGFVTRPVLAGFVGPAAWAAVFGVTLQSATRLPSDLLQDQTTYCSPWYPMSESITRTASDGQHHPFKNPNTLCNGSPPNTRPWGTPVSRTGTTGWYRAQRTHEHRAQPYVPCGSTPRSAAP